MALTEICERARQEEWRQWDAELEETQGASSRVSQEQQEEEVSRQRDALNRRVGELVTEISVCGDAERASACSYAEFKSEQWHAERRFDEWKRGIVETPHLDVRFVNQRQYGDILTALQAARTSVSTMRTELHLEQIEAQSEANLAQLWKTRAEIAVLRSYLPSASPS